MWLIFALLGPDPDCESGDTDPGTPLNPDPIRIHNTVKYLDMLYGIQQRNSATHTEPFLDMLLAFQMIHEIFTVVGPEKKQKLIILNSKVNSGNFVIVPTLIAFFLYKLQMYGCAFFSFTKLCKIAAQVISGSLLSPEAPKVDPLK